MRPARPAPRAPGHSSTLGSNGIDALRTLDADQAVLNAGFATPGITLRSGTGKQLGVSRTGQTLPDGTTSQTMKRAGCTGRCGTKLPAGASRSSTAGA